ncbi:hypothetical protein BKA67DRAFT_576687 [Truncatella angustata]|uniref:Uncharacterized protein n=1 Tax=Truncatella angustata TaxID=152316 RepID=A0A9P8UFW4_9PEZI|nr:uncharacterized protein BKA67DRAFT_576687 [Truncatella angustata]KAH6649068.1 hypothetical protein BKA67DRAFT_576687 [Truncatella angustata]
MNATSFYYIKVSSISADHPLNHAGNQAISSCRSRGPLDTALRRKIYRHPRAGKVSTFLARFERIYAL